MAALITDNPMMPQQRLDEERLLVERARRNSDAFGELYSRYYSRVYAYVYSRTSNRENAEDITSDTFLLAFEKLDRYEWRNLPFGAWLFRIASNQVAMYYRKARPSLDIEDVVLWDTEPTPEAEAISAASAQEVRSAVQVLNQDQQRAIRLRYDLGLRNREIATAMGRSEGAVKLLLHRATSALRSQVLPLSA